MYTTVRWNVLPAQCCDLNAASSPLPSHFYQLTRAKSQDISTWPIHCGDNSAQAARGTARQVSGWAERRVAAAHFPFSHTYCHCCCHMPFGHSGDVWAIRRWWVGRRSRASIIFTPLAAAAAPISRVVWKWDMSCICSHLSFPPLLAQTSQTPLPLNSLQQQWCVWKCFVPGHHHHTALCPPACSSACLSLWLPATSCLHSELAQFSCLATTWQQWVGRGIGKLAVSNWPCRVVEDPLWGLLNKDRSRRSPVLKLHFSFLFN